MPTTKTAHETTFIESTTDMLSSTDGSDMLNYTTSVYHSSTVSKENSVVSDTQQAYTTTVRVSTDNPATVAASTNQVIDTSHASDTTTKSFASESSTSYAMMDTTSIGSHKDDTTIYGSSEKPTLSLHSNSINGMSSSAASTEGFSTIKSTTSQSTKLTKASSGVFGETTSDKQTLSVHIPTEIATTAPLGSTATKNDALSSAITTVSFSFI